MKITAQFRTADLTSINAKALEMPYKGCNILNQFDEMGLMRCMTNLVYVFYLFQLKLKL
jgi:hypothetical protein